MKLKRILLNNIALKLLALLLAFVTWFYIEGATRGSLEETVLQKIFSSAYYTSKRLYIKPLFVGKVPEGYGVLKNDVKVIPEFIVVVGPSRILSEKEYIFTKPIDLSEHTKSKTLIIELENISPAIRFQKTEVQVSLPIEKL